MKCLPPENILIVFIRQVQRKGFLADSQTLSKAYNTSRHQEVNTSYAVSVCIWMRHFKISRILIGFHILYMDLKYQNMFVAIT